MSELTFRYKEQPQFKYLMDRRWRETEESNPGSLPLGEKQDILTATNIMADASRITLPEVMRRCRNFRDVEYVLNSLYPDPRSRQVSLLSAFPRTRNIEWNGCDAEWSRPNTELVNDVKQSSAMKTSSAVVKPVQESLSSDLEKEVDDLVYDPDIELLLSGKYGDDLRMERIERVAGGEDLSKFVDKPKEEMNNERE